MYEKIKVSCPVCGNVVIAPNLPDLDSKAFKCKVCGRMSRFSGCRVLGYVDNFGQPYNTNNAGNSNGQYNQYNSGFVTPNTINPVNTAYTYREDPLTFGIYPKFKVSCPKCGNVVRVPNEPGVGAKGFQCSNCGTKSRISNCRFLCYMDQYGDSFKPKVFTPRADLEDRTVYPGQKNFTNYGNQVQNQAQDQPFAQIGDIVKIRCQCGQILTFKYRSGAERAIIKCPKCSNQACVCDYERVLPSGVAPKKPKIGILRVQGTNKTFQLTLGENIIGKKANSSTATIQIDCQTRRLSRQHIVINVKEDPNEGYVYLARLYKKEVNDTYVGGKLLTFGDELYLKDKMEIRLPDVLIKFEIPDSDKTQYK